MAHEITKPLTGLLTDEHDPALRAVAAAVTAFWHAVDANQDWWYGQSFEPVINSCILGALAVRDILHGMGRTDAIVLKSGLHIQAFKEARPYRSITIGSPLAPRNPGHWNAHMIVKLGNLIIDPTLGQARRSWNGLPKSAVFENHTDARGQLHLTEDCSVRVTAQCIHRSNEHDILLTYFKPSFGVDWKTRNWRNAPDADYERRARFVKTALAIVSTSMPAAA